MIKTGVIYEISNNNKVVAYVIRNYVTREFTYSSKRQLDKINMVLRNSYDLVALPQYAGVGINQTILDKRVKLARELSAIIWFAISTMGNPSKIYEITGLSQLRIEGLTSGAEAFTMASKEYVDIGKNVIKNISRSDWDTVFGKLGIQVLKNSLI